MNTSENASPAVRSQQADDRESKLVKQCRNLASRIMENVVYSFFAVLLVAILVFDLSTGRMGSAGSIVPSVCCFLCVLTAMNSRQRRRDAALSELIRLKAPALHEELKNKGVL